MSHPSFRQLLDNHHVKNGRPISHDSPAGLPRHVTSTIQITGPTCSGKTHLLYHFLASLTLPSTSLNGHVVILDTDSRFSAIRLQSILLRQAVSSTAEGQVRSALEKIHIFRPSSTASILTTIHSLPSYLHSLPITSQQHHRLAAIMLDSASAFFYQDLASSQAGPHLAGPNLNPRLSSTIMPSLRLLQQTYHCLLVTTSRYPSRIYGPEVLNLRTRRLVPSPFGPGLSMEEALRDRDQRQQVMERGIYKCSVVENRDERDAPLHGGHDLANAGFRFRIGSDGVQIVQESD